jgi:hypothetical protein
MMTMMLMLVRWMEGPPATLPFPVSPETLWIVPCKPAPEIPVVALLGSRLVRSAHEIESDRRVGRRHPVLGFFGTIKALEDRTRTVLEMREFVYAAVEKKN